jgi:hypothetical protein
VPRSHAGGLGHHLLARETAGSEKSMFFNDAGAWLQPRAVVARVIEHLRLGGQRGGYGMRANRRIWKGGAKSTTRTSIPHRARSSRLLAWSNTW